MRGDDGGGKKWAANPGLHTVGTDCSSLGCDSRILTRAQGGKVKRPLVRELVVGAFRELPEMQYACVRVGWPCLCNGAA